MVFTLLHAVFIRPELTGQLKLLEMWEGKKGVILLNGEVDRAQENIAQPLCRPLLVWVPGHCFQDLKFMPGTLRND